MSENPTQRLPNSPSFEERVLSELAAIRRDIGALNQHLTTVENRLAKVENRLATLEERVDARLRETQPIWQNVQARLTTMEATLEDIRLQFVEIAKDSYATRARIGRLEERERSPVT